MNRHQQLDLVLNYMSKNLEDIPKRPETLTKNANLNIEKAESYSMFRMLLNDGYVYEHNNNCIYGITYKGILFLENGGYEFEHSKYRLEKKATKISNRVDVFLKPIGIITAILVIVWHIIKLLEFFGLINSSMN